MQKLTVSIIAVVGAAFAIACGDASTNTAGFYRQGQGGTSVPPGEGDEQESGGTTNPASGSGGTGSGSGSSGSSGANSSSGSSGSTEQKSFEMMLDKTTVSGDVNAKHVIQVTINPKAGFVGAVALTTSGLPADATATWDKMSVDVGPAAGTAKLTIDTKSTTPIGAATIKITGTGGAVTAASNVGLTINPTMTFTFRMNATGASYMEDSQGRAIAPGTYNIAAGTASTLAVKITNKDGTGHIIHGPGGNFPHGNTGSPIQANGTDPANRTVAKGSPIQFYAHDLNNSGSAIRIQFQ